MTPDDRTIQDDLLDAVLADDPAAAIAGIDAALVRGASFTEDSVEPLRWAATKGHAAVVAHLIARGARMAHEWPGAIPESALHVAAAADRPQIIHLLVRDADGRDFIDGFDYLERTPLIIAAEAGNLPLMWTLIELGADVNAHDEQRAGDTAVKHAARDGQPDAVRLLLQAGADPTIPGWMGISAIHAAQLAGDAGKASLEIIRAHLNLPEPRWRSLLLPR